MTTAARIADGTIVTIHYTLTDDTGEVLDSSRDSEPLDYLQGAGNIVPGLERKMMGHGVGDTMQVVVAPADAYGEREEMEAQKVPRSVFPADAEFEEGMPIAAEGPDGEMTPLWITHIDDEAIYVDTNHPLAGVTLHFDVEVMAIRAATAEEMEHGHPHGPDGHHDHH
ncbi:MAG: peptidylprolyl isomerase [Pseudomonadota bacterium]